MNNIKPLLLIIGNEILSEKILYINTQFLAKNLVKISTNLTNIEIIKNDRNMIMNNIKYFKNLVDYILKIKLLEPTHDNITAESILVASGKNHIKDENMHKIFLDKWQNNLNLIYVKISYKLKLLLAKIGDVAFMIENILVMPGILNEMQQNFGKFINGSKNFRPILSEFCEIYNGENFILKELDKIQNHYPEVEIDNYSFEHNGQYGSNIIMRSNDWLLLKNCYEEIKILSEKYDREKL